MNSSLMCLAAKSILKKVLPTPLISSIQSYRRERSDDSDDNDNAVVGSNIENEEAHNGNTRKRLSENRDKLTKRSKHMVRVYSTIMCYKTYRGLIR